MSFQPNTNATSAIIPSLTFLSPNILLICDTSLALRFTSHRAAVMSFLAWHGHLPPLLDCKLPEDRADINWMNCQVCVCMCVDTSINGCRVN